MSDNTTVTSLEEVFDLQNEELSRLVEEYLATEQRFSMHTNSTVYDELEPDAKSLFTKTLNELSKPRDDIVLKVAKAKARVQTTRALIEMQGKEARTTESGRIPVLPQFRGEEQTAIKYANEFLREAKSLLEDNKVPVNEWLSAILNAMTNTDRQWAVQNLRGRPWASIERAFLNHFEPPALRDQLIRDLMAISIKEKESVQEYSDRFIDLMVRIGKKDDNDLLVAVYIDGLDSKLQELMRVTRASHRSMWIQLNNETAPVSVATEIENAIAFDSARNSRSRSQGAAVASVCKKAKVILPQ